MLAKIGNWFRRVCCSLGQRLFGIGVEVSAEDPYTGKIEIMPSWVVILKYSSNTIGYALVVLSVVAFVFGLSLLGWLLTLAAFVLIAVGVAVFHYRSFLLWYKAGLIWIMRLASMMARFFRMEKQNVKFVTKS